MNAIFHMWIFAHIQKWILEMWEDFTTVKRQGWGAGGEGLILRFGAAAGVLGVVPI